ncbi:MAG: 4-hydroxythreonine-4-phosphate dehydrogenase PdxA [Bacteroidales bacterium]|nr:4-hydroxythreonine-4-phosphate dehydrogenase PdxA [Bacteroidales bacterium]
MEKNKIKVGITQGDINGVSYEVIIKTLSDSRIMDFCTPIVYGSPKVLAYHRKAINVDNFSLTGIVEAREASFNKGYIINCHDDNIRVELGKPTPYCGEAAYQALEIAVKDLSEHQIDVLVTAPINKHTIQQKDFKFPGHTEYLQDRFNAEETLMLMVAPDIRIGVVTGHIALADVPAALTEELLLKKLRLMVESLKNDFNIHKPRIAVLGLNPHAGDQGLLGNEEVEVIMPAMDKARDEGIMVLGPFAADGLFGSGQYSKFDGILAMYHDQGLAPFKALSFDQGVNYTAGLPVVRTSPVHGTAYEIAGQGVANPASFREALYLACDIFKTRKMNKELQKNAMVTKPKNTRR